VEINSEGEVFIGSNDIHKFSNGVWSNFSEDTQVLGYIDAEIFLSK
jgi:hypothetical protein